MDFENRKIYEFQTVKACLQRMIDEDDTYMSPQCTSSLLLIIDQTK